MVFTIGYMPVIVDVLAGALMGAVAGGVVGVILGAMNKENVPLKLNRTYALRGPNTLRS